MGEDRRGRRSGGEEEERRKGRVADMGIRGK